MAGHMGSTDTEDATDGRARRFALLAGPAAIAVSAIGIFGSVILASWITGSWFTWTGNALSHLGEVGRTTAPLFNGSLLVVGVLGLAFGWWVWTAATNHWQRLGALLLAAAMANAGLVGVFPLPNPEHGPVSVAFFVLFTFGLFVHGSGDALAGRPHRGVRSIWYGIAHVTGWALFGLAPFSGIAIPELVGVLALWAWTAELYLGAREGAGSR